MRDYERPDFVLILAFAPGATVASVGVVWLLLFVVEWLADRFANWLWRGWVTHWSALRIRALVHAISAKWTVNEKSSSTVT
jgi:hypothetical protein